MVSQLHIEPPHCCAAGTQNPSKISGTLTWQAGSAGRLFVTNAGGSGYTIGPARPETLGDLVDCSLSRTFLPEFPFLGFIFVGGLVLFELNQKSPGRTAFQRILHRTTKLNHGNHLICSYSPLYYKFKSNLAPHSGVVHKYHLMEKVGSKPSFFSIKRFSADLIASSRISFKSSSEMPFRTSSSSNWSSVTPEMRCLFRLFLQESQSLFRAMKRSQ